MDSKDEERGDSANPLEEIRNAARQEFNELLKTLGATGQDNLALEQLGRVSYGYRRWLATQPKGTLVQPKKFWYGIVQVPKPSGDVAVARFVNEVHPVEMLIKGTLPHDAVLSFFSEIPEEVYNLFKNQSTLSIVR